MCEGEREPRRYKLKLQEFLWPCISISVGLGFLANIPLHAGSRERGGGGGRKPVKNIFKIFLCRTAQKKAVKLLKKHRLVET